MRKKKDPFEGLPEAVHACLSGSRRFDSVPAALAVFRRLAKLSPEQVKMLASQCRVEPHALGRLVRNCRMAIEAADFAGVDRSEVSGSAFIEMTRRFDDTHSFQESRLCHGAEFLATKLFASLSLMTACAKLWLEF